MKIYEFNQIQSIYQILEKKNTSFVKFLRLFLHRIVASIKGLYVATQTDFAIDNRVFGWDVALKSNFKAFLTKK